MSDIIIAIQQVAVESTGSVVKAVEYIRRDDFTLTFEVTLGNGRHIFCRTPCPNTSPSVIGSEVATIKYIADRTSIPVPLVVGFNLNESACRPLGAFVLLEKPSGVSLDTLFTTLSSFEQNLIVAQVANWMLEIFSHRFDAIGSLTMDGDHVEYHVGPIVRRPFYTDGRARLVLNRGPFKTAKAYYLACGQRELDCSRVLFVQDASPDYRRNLEDGCLQVERIVGLLCDLISRCEGLDTDDPVLAPFSLDIHQLGLKNMYVSPENPSQITSVVDWQFVSTRPLWCCARLPPWLHVSLSGHDQEVNRLSTIFRAEIARVDGSGSTFLRAMGCEDTRCILDELADYDAFKDGFLLLLALENILATLPGYEDLPGLTALLDLITLPTL
ncbi:hypothetical protein AcW1_008119 [Taiwanofungus camphoratus]|nr:hypothetical protein AcV5_008420 [Antrodia cinnamomea]KAI0950952.1 hypothetical protein AcW1_008119 [Antrodia cinnamomea]KAI0955863.1 hypothetical protein AcV7_006411 [Antrodia cinnamomea]